MPLLQTLGNNAALAWGRLKRILKLNWVIQNIGSGYGIKTLGKLGNLYYQTYGSTVKLTKNGEFGWARSLGAGNVYTLSADTAENIYIAGPSNFLVAKFNSSGTIQWQRNLSNGTSDGAQDMVANSIGTTYTVGKKTVGSNNYGVITCTDSGGSVVWSQYNTSVSTDYQAVGYVAAGAFTAVAVGYTSGLGAVSVVAFAGGSGAVQWQRTITPTDGQIILTSGCVMDSSGNVYVTGASGSPRHSFIVKYNSTGTFIWAKQLEVSGVYSYNDYGTPGVDSAGNIYLSLYVDNNNIDGANNGGGFAKFDSSGNLLLIRKINNVNGWLRMNVASDGTVALMGTAGVAKLNGDGSGLGTYPGFTYASSSLTATTPSFNYAGSSYSFSSAGYSAVASSYSVSTSSVSPSVQYIGTEVG